MELKTFESVREADQYALGRSRNRREVETGAVHSIVDGAKTFDYLRMKLKTNDNFEEQIVSPDFRFVTLKGEVNWDIFENNGLLGKPIVCVINTQLVDEPSIRLVHNSKTKTKTIRKRNVSGRGYSVQKVASQVRHPVVVGLYEVVEATDKVVLLELIGG